MKKNLIEKYENICNEIVKEFSKKQEIEFDGWIADEVGSIAGFIQQYFFTVDDMVLDIKTNQPKGFILDWQSDLVDCNSLKDESERIHINYKSYTMGIRPIHIKQRND